MVIRIVFDVLKDGFHRRPAGSRSIRALKKQLQSSKVRNLSNNVIGHWD